MNTLGKFGRQHEHIIAASMVARFHPYERKAIPMDEKDIESLLWLLDEELSIVQSAFCFKEKEMD